MIQAEIKNNFIADILICELFSFLPECDIPNWLTLLIEILLGFGIAFFIYYIQRWNRIKRSNVFMTTIVNDLIPIHLQLQKLQNTIFVAGGKNHYDQDISNRWLVFTNDWKNIKENAKIIDMSILGGSDVLNENDLLDLQSLTFFLGKDIMADQQISFKTSLSLVMSLDTILEVSVGILKKYQKNVEKYFEHINSKFDEKISRKYGSDASDMDLSIIRHWEKRKNENLKVMQSLFELLPRS